MEPLILALCLFFPIIINSLAEIRPKGFPREWGYGAALGFAVLTFIAYQNQASVDLLFFRWRDYLTVGFRLDAFSGLMSATVALIGASVMKYSVRYLAEDPHRLTFHRNLSATLCSVLLMVNSANLLMYWVSWVGTSYFLHQLLVHFKNREGAQRAARQKFLVSRIGDVFLVAASLLLFRAYQTLDFETILSQSKNSALLLEHSVSIYGAAIFLVMGAMTKSAQFPFHFWLPKTLDTPTPVSALMHAGIINAGGFLIIRMGGFLEQVPWALGLLAAVGGFTAIYGSIIMFSQSSVKKFLAYSTISQMGFMMLQCGLGAFSIAMVHIVGHAFYKAYSFLSAGAVTDYGKLHRYLETRTEDPHFVLTWGAGILSLTFALLMGPFVGYNFEKPGALVLLVVLGLAMAQIFVSYTNKWDALKSMIVLWTAYFILYHGVEAVLRTSILTQTQNAVHGWSILNGLVSLSFIALYFAQNNLTRISRTELGQRIYVSSLNGGFYGH